MRNLSPAACGLLKMRLLTLPRLHGALQARMERTVAPFTPAGWCAGVRRADGETAFAWGGEAIAAFAGARGKNQSRCGRGRRSRLPVRLYAAPAAHAYRGVDGRSV